MKKILALLLIISVISLCMFSCRNKNNGNDDNNQGGEVKDDESIVEEGGEDGILNEDNIDPNGWTKVD